MDAADLSATLSATLQFHGQNRNEWPGRRFVEVGRRTGESLVPAGRSRYLAPIRDSSERVVDTLLTGCRCLLWRMDPCRYLCPAHPAGCRASNLTMTRPWVATLSHHSPEPSPDPLPHPPTSRLSHPDAGGNDLWALLLARWRGRWVGEGLGECPGRVRFHDDSRQTERTDLITSDRGDQLSSFGAETQSSTHRPSGLLMVKLTYNRVLCRENLPRRSPRISRANQTRTTDQIQFDFFASGPRSG